MIRPIPLLSRPAIWLSGVDYRRLSGHSSSARAITVAIGTLFIVTFLIAFIQGFTYAYEALATFEVSATLRLCAAAGAALLWAAFIVIIDRSLVVISDAIGNHAAIKCLIVGLRLVAVVVVSGLIAHELIKEKYRATIAATADQMAIEQRERAIGISIREFAPMKDQLKDLEAKQHELNNAIVPIAITRKFAAVAQCSTQASKIAASLKRAEYDGDTKRAGRLRRVLRERTDQCHQLATEADTARASYLKEIETQKQDLGPQLRAARERATDAAERYSKEIADRDRRATEQSRSITARDAAWEAVQQQHPQIRYEAWQIWGVLIFFETLALLGKLTSRNNPIAAETQADLEEESARHRSRRRLSIMQEKTHALALTRPDVRAEMDVHLKRYSIVENILAAWRRFSDQLVSDSVRMRERARSHPDIAATLHAVHSETIANVAEILSEAKRETPYPMAAE